MAKDVNNRYALFRDTEDDENMSPMGKLYPDPLRNPFLNQVADDSTPWQEVTKRGAQVGTPTIRTRTGSASTMISDKLHDPHENWCGVCSQKFTSKSILLSHIRQSPEDHKSYCNLCKRVFKDQNGLKNHLMNSNGHEVHCNVCFSAFNNEWGLKNHFENNYTTEHKYVCLTCLLGFRTHFELERHLQTAEKHTWCESCCRRFRNQDERDEHWRKTMKHKHCLEPGCDFDGPGKAELDAHRARDHFQCAGCKRIFPSQTKLNQHIEGCMFAIACPQCGLSCGGQSQLGLHLQACYYCAECGFQTYHEGSYKIHITKHATSKIPCWGCNAPMGTYSSLVNHLESGKCRNFHDPSRLILCLGKWWYSSLYMDLDIHANLRTGRINPDNMREWMDEGSLFPFVCRDECCGKVFGHLSSLVLHCESQACDWDIARLNMPGLEKIFKELCLGRSNGDVCEAT